MTIVFRWVRGLIVHIRAGYSPFSYNNCDCGCIFGPKR